MRKWNDMFLICVWLVLIMVTCALLMRGLDEAHRVVLLLAAMGTGCVYMCCESRVERAHAPLILRDETLTEKTKPPESTAE